MPMRIGVSSLGLMAAASGWLAAASAVMPARAYTADQQQLCTPDAFRLCGPAIPDVDRVTACMIQNRALLSPGCAQFFRGPVVQETPVTARKPAKLRKSKKSRRS